MAGYLFDQAWTQEKRRLDALGAHYDVGTFERLDRLGITPGLRCLEVGAGSGTVARWMAERVGEGGRVVATDIDPRYLELLAGERIEVRRHDIAADPLEPATFDLIHARTVLQHVAGRDAALHSMVRALRPGGRLLLEDIISPHGTTHPPLPAWAKLLRAMERGLRARGAEPDYGLQLPGALATSGLIEVGCDARVDLMYSGTPSIDFIALSVEHAGPHLVEAGIITAAEIDELLAALRTPGYTTATATMIAAWGTAPSAP